MLDYLAVAIAAVTAWEAGRLLVRRSAPPRHPPPSRNRCRPSSTTSPQAPRPPSSMPRSRGPPAGTLSVGAPRPGRTISGICRPTSGNGRAPCRMRLSPPSRRPCQRASTATWPAAPRFAACPTSLPSSRSSARATSSSARARAAEAARGWAASRFHPHPQHPPHHQETPHAPLPRLRHARRRSRPRPRPRLVWEGGNWVAGPFSGSASGADRRRTRDDGGAPAPREIPAAVTGYENPMRPGPARRATISSLSGRRCIAPRRDPRRARDELSG